MYKGMLSKGRTVSVTCSAAGANTGNAGVTATWLGSEAPPPVSKMIMPGLTDVVLEEAAKLDGLQIDAHPPAGGSLTLTVKQDSQLWSEPLNGATVWVFDVQ